MFPTGERDRERRQTSCFEIRLSRRTMCIKALVLVSTTHGRFVDPTGAQVALDNREERLL